MTTPDSRDFDVICADCRKIYIADEIEPLKNKLVAQTLQPAGACPRCNGFCFEIYDQQCQKCTQFFPSSAVTADGHCPLCGGECLAIEPITTETETPEHPSKRACVANSIRADDTYIGIGHDQLLEGGHVKVGRCRECRKRVAPCDLSYKTDAARDPSTYFEDGTRLGGCPMCGADVFVECDLQCSGCGEMWFWWEFEGLAHKDVEDTRNDNAIGSCPSCNEPCYLVGVGATADAAREGPPRGITGLRARTNTDFRDLHRAALETIKDAYMCAVEATEKLAVVEEFIGQMSWDVVDSFDAVEDRDGEVKAEWPSDAFAYYNEQLGRAVAMRCMVNAAAENINDIAVGLREHDRRWVRKS